MIERICENCLYFDAAESPALQFGVCKRYPHDADKGISDTCGEFSPGSKILSDEILETSVFAPGWFSAHALCIFRRNKIKTVADILDLGRSAMRSAVDGALDRETIKEVSTKLLEFGVRW